MYKRIVIFPLFLTSLIFNSCRNGVDVVETDQVQKNSASFPVLTLIHPDNICADEEFTISLNINAAVPGEFKILLSDDDGKSWEEAGSVSGNCMMNDFDLVLGYGSYRIKGVYKGSVDGRNMVISSAESFLKTADCSDCLSIIMEPELISNNYLVNPGDLLRFTVAFTIATCDQDYYDLSLKGRLINEADYKSSYPDIVRTGEKPYPGLIQWNIGDLEAGLSSMCEITFEYRIPMLPYGSMIPITKGWILEGKRKDGSAVSIGSNNEIFVQVQLSKTADKEKTSYEI